MKVRKVNLVDLAPIWLDKAPRADETMGIKSDRSPEPPVDQSNDGQPTFSSDKIKGFFHDVVLKITEGINAEVQAPYIGVIISMLSRFDEKFETPSVVDFETAEPYQVLSDISLIDHTINVARRMLQKLDEKAKHKDLVLPLLVTALAHDFGKLEGEQGLAGHSQTSFAYLKKKMDSKNKTANLIMEAVRLHHHPAVDKRKNWLLESLVEANTMDRELSLAKRALKSPEAEGEQEVTENPTFSEKQLLEKIKSRISSVGFDVFSFEGKTYITPAVLREIVCELEGGAKKIDQIELVKKRIANVFGAGIKILNGQFRLKYTKRDFRPDKKYYFVLSNEDIALADSAQLNPRDEKGRWLKKIEQLKILRD